MRKCVIEVLGLRNRMAKQSDSRLAWFMFHKIYCLYSDIKKKEEINVDMVLTSMPEHVESNKVNIELKD